MTGDQLPRYDEAVAILRKHQRGSTSFLQRTLGVEYNEACQYIERMEKEGLVSRPNQDGARQWLDGRRAEAAGTTHSPQKTAKNTRRARELGTTPCADDLRHAVLREMGMEDGFYRDGMVALLDAYSAKQREAWEFADRLDLEQRFLAAVRITLAEGQRGLFAAVDERERLRGERDQLRRDLAAAEQRAIDAEAREEALHYEMDER